MTHPYWTITEAAAAIEAGDVLPSQLLDEVLARIERLDPTLHSYGTVLAPRAREHALALDQMLAAGVHLGPLHGIPVAVKDNMDTAGIATTSGSVLHRDRVPVRNATAVQRLYAAGAVVVGKTNLYEWAFGGPSTLWGDVANPWNPSCTAGASSNGSAAAVAAGLALAALGTDLGGSIRIPAAMCGCFGLKPTIGRVSRRGVVPAASTLDHVGPITWSAADAALVLDAIAGPDPCDRATLQAPPPDDYYASAARRDVSGLRIGVPRLPDVGVLGAEMKSAFDNAATVFTHLGCHLTKVELPDLADARTLMWAISAVEGAEYHRELLRLHADAYQKNVRALLQTGALFTGVDYVHCQRVRQLFVDQLAETFTTVDALLTPVLPLPAWQAASDEVVIGNTREDNMAAMTRYSPLFNLTGHPAASMLAGFSADGLPLSVQLVAPHFHETTVLRLAAAFERNTEFGRRRPVLGTNVPTADATTPLPVSAR